MDVTINCNGERAHRPQLSEVWQVAERGATSGAAGCWAISLRSGPQECQERGMPRDKRTDGPAKRGSGDRLQGGAVSERHRWASSGSFGAGTTCLLDVSRSRLTCRDHGVTQVGCLCARLSCCTRGYRLFALNRRACLVRSTKRASRYYSPVNPI